ncbi:MAG: hypothetical protein ABFE07_14525 [Armatimonadia bacterium]
MLRRFLVSLVILPILLVAGCAPVGLRVPWGLSKLPWTVLYLDSNQRLVAQGMDHPLLEKAQTNSVAPSPSGAHLAAVDEQGRLSIVPIVAGARVQIDAGPVDTSFWPKVSPWSADGRSLVYVARGDIMYYRLGRKPRQLTTTKDAFTPTLSPDGSLVAYGRRTKEAQQDLGLWVVSVKGGEPRQLVDATGDVFSACCPTWSPDQQWIAFLQAYEGGAVGVVKSDGSGVNVGIEAAWLPLCWSPDSTTVVFPKIYYGESGDGLWRYSVGTQQTEMLAGKGLTAEPIVSADYTRAILAMAEKQVEGKPRRTKLLEYALPAWQRGSEQATLPGQAVRGLFSPDGAQVALLMVEDNKFPLYVGPGTVKGLKKIAAAEELMGWVRLPVEKE